MAKIRIGKDFSVEWPILTNGDPLPLEGRDLRLELHCPNRTTVALPFEVDGINIVTRIKPVYQVALGSYRFTLWENWEKDGQTMVDSCNAFQLVDSTLKEGTSACDHSANIEISHLRLTAGEMTFTPIKIGGGSDIVVDAELSLTSENPVQNKVITKEMRDISEDVDGIAEDVRGIDKEMDTLTENVRGIDKEMDTLAEKVDNIVKDEIVWTDVE